MESPPRVEGAPNLAFYYPAFMWTNSDWIKNIILFFDGVALLVPEYMRDRPFHVDPVISTALQEHGLLTILEPESFIDQNAAESLTSQLVDLMASGALDQLAQEKAPFGELSYSRLGGMADPGLANMVIDELRKRGLARQTEDGLSIPVHRDVHALVLVLLAQILRAPGRERGLDLHPATDRPRVHNALTKLLNLPSMPSVGQVVSLDLQTVGVDLGSVPLDEVLDFRRMNGFKYRRYAQELREFVSGIRSASAEDQQEELRLRQERIRETANDLARTAQEAWKRPPFLIGIAGAVWTVATGDPIAGIFGVAAVGADLLRPREAGAYSYLFDAHTQFPPTR